MKIVIIIWQSLQKSIKRKLFSVIILQILSAIFDLLVVILLYEFVKRAINNRIESTYDIYLLSSFDPIITISLIFILVIIISAILKISLIKISNSFAFEVGASISSIFYKKILLMPYLFHSKKNSSELINIIFHKTNSVIYEIVLPFLAITSTLFMSIGILSALFYINYFATLLMIVLTAITYLILFKISNKILVKNGQIVNTKQDQALKSLQEGLKVVRHIIIDNTYNYFINDYENKNIQLRMSQAKNQFLAAFPRAIIESFALLMLVIGTLALYLYRINSLQEYIPLLVAVVLAIQRFLPGMHQVYHSVATIKGGIPAFKNIEEIMIEPERTNPQNENILNFNNSIILNQVSFSYENKLIIKDFNLIIKKGQKIGICGKTGTGKSTLVDLIMGLYLPVQGNIKVDNKIITEENISQYRKLFSQVDQNTYLLDDSITNNIALGINQKIIDDKKIQNTAQKANALEFIINLENKFSEKIGENGFNLSGGERQRLSLARALYKDSDILILDEFTSSLDEGTERSVMDSIYSIDGKTIIMIAHRLNTLKNCDVIIELFDDNRYLIHENKI
ncbi:MAG: ABC transporter ATP-binding protein/permease [Polynucleobacter sp.]|nr:ABC transporter ATP-binding protein/permease [Polynucleobacter sp.]